MSKNKDGISAIIYLVVFVGWLVFAFFSSSKPEDGYEYVNSCDYKTMSLKTAIHTETSTGETRIIEGNLFGFLTDPAQLITDPLTMKDESGNVIGYAGDTYHLIGQDDHGIYLNDTHVYDVKGKYAFWGDKYEIYSHDGDLLATAEFNAFDTKGQMIDVNGSLIAEYHSNALKNDYEVYVYNDEIIDENSLLMIFASYVSDRKADSSSGGSSSSHRSSN